MGGGEGIEGMQGRMTGGQGLLLSLPQRSLMEAVLSKLCRFIRGLVSDKLELSVIEEHPHTYLCTPIQISERTHTHTHVGSHTTCQTD